MAKILVVDDSWVARLGMSKLLVSLGHEVTEASNGQQALDQVAQSRPDAVFLDLLMPDMDGFAVLEALAASRSTVPVIVLSADIQETTLTKCRDLGARECLHKPPTRDLAERALRGLE